MQGTSQKDISEKLGISAETISGIKDNIACNLYFFWQSSKHWNYVWNYDRFNNFAYWCLHTYKRVKSQKGKIKNFKAKKYSDNPVFFTS